MIYLILGANTYQAEQELRTIVAAFDGIPERLDSSALTENTLADSMRGGTLFSAKRLVVLRQLSDSKPIFEKLAEWAGDVPDDTTIVLVEQKLDKRTKAYKTITKIAKVIAVEPLMERDYRVAEQWLDGLANRQKVILSRPQLHDMVSRALVPGEKPSARNIDQMQLAQAIKALKGAGKVTDDLIATVLPLASSDTVFNLFELAIARRHERVNVLIDELRRNEDGHQTFALLMGQWAQLVSVALADTPPATIAVELGLHPYVAKKFAELSRQFTRIQLRTLTTLAADLDAAAKLSQFAPWDGVYRFMYAIANR